MFEQQLNRHPGSKPGVGGWSAVLAAGVVAALVGGGVRAEGVGSAKAVEGFKKDVQPILAEYCYDCHGDGAKKGNVAFDGFKSDAELVQNRDLWLAVLKNVRAGVMPPAKKEKPSDAERAKLEQWIKYQAFGIDPEHPDPGRVTLRRLNRVEYRNTIRDLMGIDYRTDEEFPPDDTGYGFDNIGDVLSVSPLLLEKYLQAAEAIVGKAVPTVSRVVSETTIPGMAFRGDGQEGGGGGMGRGRGQQGARTISFYTPAKVASEFVAKKPGTYRITVNLSVNGAFDFDPGKCNFTFKAGDEELLNQEFVWQDGKRFTFTYERKWEAGQQVPLAFELTPLTPAEKRKTSVDMRILSVQVEGPTEKEHWGRPANFDRFFTKDAPEDAEGRRAYAREILARFANKAFRRPVDEKTVQRLVEIAEDAWGEAGKTFEEGVGRAMVAVLASPRFLFRIENVQPVANAEKAPHGAAVAPVDEYALASRLSYFLWSTMPDDELLGLAARGELRKNLPAQVKRMLADRRSEALVENFAGQWLQVRDVEGISIDARSVLSRDQGVDKDLQKLFAQFRELRAKREAETQKLAAEGKPIPKELAQGSPEEEKLREQLRQFRRGPAVELDGALRNAMKRETEMFFAHVMREDASVLDFLDSDYTFLNERLARHYGIPDVKGEEMRKVTLPEGSPRGGLLTMGSVLVVTSNPTRTSPVKRGLFVLENVLGSPTPPPPDNVPELEAAEKEFQGKEPTLREVLELHRASALCSSCHNRMDPLGLALENFNAMGMWRESERKQPIDASAQLITGESFKDIRELKKILREKHRKDFYQCLTEKLMTYALGRGLEYYDVESVDKIVERLAKEDGKFSALIAGVVESAPFQMRRNAENQTVAATERGSN